MSGGKPAPTAAEVDAARRALPGAIKYLVSMGWDGYEKLAVLLAALDAAEARATAAERERDDWKKAHAIVVAERDARIKPEKCLSNGSPERPDGPRCDRHGEYRCFDCRGWLCGLHARWHFDGEVVGIRSRAETAERERDELRDALKLYEAFPELATGDTARRDEQRAAYNGLRWVLGLLAGLDDGRQDSVAKAFRPVVEKIKRERDEARAALKPFASFSAGMSRMVPSSTEVLYIDGSKAGLTAGDFRAAAAALKEAPRG